MSLSPDAGWTTVKVFSIRNLDREKKTGEALVSWWFVDDGGGGGDVGLQIMLTW